MYASVTEEMLVRGHVISTPGYHSVQQNVYLSVPALPSPANWTAFVGERPCALSVRADDVTVDLGGFVLAASTEHTQGLVLVHVAPGTRNFRLAGGGGQLMTCCIGVFLEAGCVACSVEELVVSNFLEKGILSYSPQGLTVEACVIGPNLSKFHTISQELYDLVRYGPAISPQNLRAWQTFSDNSLLAETSHVVGIAVVPDASREAPYPVRTDTGSGVVLSNVQVQKLTMNFREHSLVVSIGLVTAAIAKARGVLGEVLPEWYLLRREAARRLQKGFYPSLAPPQRAFITSAGGFLVNTGDAGPEETATAWVRGVDRLGNAVRGVQAVLIVGAGTPALQNLVAEMPVFATLHPRVLLPAPKHVEKTDLSCAKRAFGVLLLPAPAAAAPSVGCCAADRDAVAAGAAAYFARESISFNIRPQGNRDPHLTGTFIAVPTSRSDPF